MLHLPPNDISAGGFVDRGTVVVIERDDRPVACCAHWTNGDGNPSTEQMHILFPASDQLNETGVGAWPAWSGDKHHGAYRVRLRYVTSGEIVTQDWFAGWLKDWLNFHNAQEVPRWSRTVAWTALEEGQDFSIKDVTPGFRSRYYEGAARAKNAQYWAAERESAAQTQFRCAAWLLPKSTVVGLKYQEHRAPTRFGAWAADIPLTADRYVGQMTLKAEVSPP